MRKKVIQFIEDHRDQIVDTLCELVSISSVNPPGQYGEISQLVEEIFGQFGLETQRIEVPMEALEVEGVNTPRINVLGTLPGTSTGPTLVLNPHMDVVPVGDLSKWDGDPFTVRIENGVLYGRGVNDDKGDIAAYAWALRAIRETGRPLKGKAIIAATVDEESGGHLGTEFLLEKGYLNPDLAIVEGFTHHVMPASNGVIHMRITTVGVTSHAAFPEEGLNAIEKMVDVLKALQTYRDGLYSKQSSVQGIGHPTLNIGTIQGGEKTNIVPDQCTVTVDRRVLPEEEAKTVEKEIFNLLADLKKVDPILKVEANTELLADSWGPVDRNNSLIVSLCRNIREITGHEGYIKGIPGFNDGRFYYRRGIPVALYGAGPMDIKSGRTHSYNELLCIEDLIASTKIVALTIIDLLG